MNRLNFKNFHLSKQTFLMIAIAFAFSVLVRLYWVYWASGYLAFYWNNELMISTNDGYAFAEGARDMLAGFHQPNDLSYVGMSLSTLTFWIVKIFGFKIEAVMLYLSVFVGSLIVVPVLLIALEYGAARAGFIAALLASVADSYYNRTMAGYYDTDMLVIVIPMFMIWGLIRVIERKNSVDIIIAPIFVLMYNWWYLSGFSLISVTTVIFLLYTLILDRKNMLNYVTIALMLLGIANLNFYAKVLLMVAIYIGVLFKKDRLNLKISFFILGAACIVFVLGGGLNPIVFQLKFYVFRGVSEVADVSFNYFNVNQTIQESGIVNLALFCERISGSVVVFLLSLIGLCAFCFKHKSAFISLSMIALGFLALKGGLRFTIYAVPVMALGFGYFVTSALEYFKFKDIKYKIAYACILILSLYPVAKHIYGYKIPPVFYEKEVRVLDEFKKIAGREDYALAWWDYGYPIRYYSDVKTLIDGGKHLGRDNFAVSFALGSKQNSSANMARLEVEYTELGFNQKIGENLKKMMSDANSSSIGEFLANLDDKNISLPPKTREIYYYLPDRMINIFPTILQFSRLDLKTGQKFADPLFFAANSLQQTKEGIMLSPNVILSNKLDSVIIGSNKLKLNSFYETKYNENGKLDVNVQVGDDSSKYYVIFMRDYGRILLLDEEMFNSTFVQLFVLERFDSELFEPVILDSSAKIYKLKR